MDYNEIIELGTVKRELRTSLPCLKAVGWLPRHEAPKVDIVNGGYIDFGFNIRPSGATQYEIVIDGKTHYKASFPVGTMRHHGHGYRINYDGTFETLYFCYEPKYLEFFERLVGGSLPDAPWTMASSHYLEREVAEFKELMDNYARIGWGDRLDAAAWTLVTEALLCRNMPVFRKPRDRETLASIAVELGERPLAEILKTYGMSSRSFFRKWSKAYFETPSDYILGKRLRKAAILLSEGSSVKEAAQAAGFSSPFHLSRQFKAHYKISPKQYSKENAMVSL